MADYLQILKRYWGYDSFRGVQQDIIESVGQGKDTLGLMPTGGGKSVTFQVPALAMEGVCIVITPLVALMKDQVQNLRSRHIRAAAIYSGMQNDDILQTLENAIFGGVKFLYVSPERLSSELFRVKLRHMNICFICVDEAHCISQWGYDFRPSYLTISDIRHDLPDVPILALTATATPEVVDDIQHRLLFKEKNVFRMSFERKNLAYVVRYNSNKEALIIHILNNVGGSAIVYARSRKRVQELSDMLNAAHLNATYFHAGLDNAEKDKRQQQWQDNHIRVMVATNAFGMGIDKPDVRLVIHADSPSSVEAYFQEAGRAGRDGKKAFAVLIFDMGDTHKLHKRISDAFPEKDYIRRVYDSLAYFYQVGVGSGYQATFELPIDKFCKTYGLSRILTVSSLQILDRAGYIEFAAEQDSQARVLFLLERDELYRLRGNSENEDSVITALLRNYSGLFCDYVYIDEAFIAQETGLTQPVVYNTLKLLSQKHIVSFIPQKTTPYVRFLQRREDSQYLQFPPAVYDDLKRRMADHIEAMIAYATTDNVCRSRQLLAYFGESRSHDCGHCDVCIDRKKKERDDEAEQKILQMLGDHQQHHVRELYDLGVDVDRVLAVLDGMLKERVVINEDNVIYLA
jgi:ATP-dependent DNA helicase RecQ